jgi:predicted DNA-binding transcriptional regulator AlpA
MELLAKQEVCHLFGGINPSTLYRHIQAGRLPKPVKIGGSSRWLRTECEAVLRSMVEGRAVS